jgi:hypothetical protein
LALIFAFDEQFSLPLDRTLLVKSRKQGFFFASSMLCSFRQHFPGDLRSQETDERMAALAGRTGSKRKRRIPAMGVVTGSLFAI